MHEGVYIMYRVISTPTLTYNASLGVVCSQLHLNLFLIVSQPVCPKHFVLSVLLYSYTIVACYIFIQLPYNVYIICIVGQLYEYVTSYIYKPKSAHFCKSGYNYCQLCICCFVDKSFAIRRSLIIIYKHLKFKCSSL